MHSPAMKFGGFGPWYSLMLVLAKVGLFYVSKKEARTILLAIFAVIGISLLNPAAWWARYVPWLWLLPTSVLVALLIYGRGHYAKKHCNGFGRGLGYQCKFVPTDFSGRCGRFYGTNLIGH